MMVLLIDAGNRRIKWALIQDEVWQQHGQLENGQAATLPKLFSELPSPHKVLVSNVAGEHMGQQLRAACAAWTCPIDFISAQVEQCGVRNTYQPAAQLGSDRWAALIAARHQLRTACLVVDCGTATTIDALSAEGEFLGGLILPGLNMMRRSLSAGSALQTQKEGEQKIFPRNTADAIFSGAIQATVGAIQLQFEALIAHGATHSVACCLLSGGAADCLQPHLKLPLVREESLVLLGLQIIGHIEKGVRA